MRKSSMARAVQASARIAVPDDVALGRFSPATELGAWAMETFVADGGPLCNVEHRHLRSAKVAWLWAPVENARAGMQILGTAQLGKVVNSDAWLRGQREQQLHDWFGEIPDFLITIGGEYWADPGTEDAMRCALVEHELYHCAIAKNKFNMPKINQMGMPIWGMRPHDVEVFVGEVARYGSGATYTEALAKAYAHGPTIAPASIAAVCGTCRR